MIEALVLSICAYGSAEACSNGAAAYYKQSGLEQTISAKEAAITGRYPAMAAGIAVVGAIAQGRATFSIGGGKSLTVEPERNMLGIKAGF